MDGIPLSSRDWKDLLPSQRAMDGLVPHVHTVDNLSPSVHAVDGLLPSPRAPPPPRKLVKCTPICVYLSTRDRMGDKSTVTEMAQKKQRCTFMSSDFASHGAPWLGFPLKGAEYTLFGSVSPRNAPAFGGILRIPTYNTVPDECLQSNKLAMLRNIGNVSEDLHTYILLVWVDLDPKKVYFLKVRLHAHYNGNPSHDARAPWPTLPERLVRVPMVAGCDETGGGSK